MQCTDIEQFCVAFVALQTNDSVLLRIRKLSENPFPKIHSQQKWPVRFSNIFLSFSNQMAYIAKMRITVFYWRLYLASSPADMSISVLIASGKSF